MNSGLACMIDSARIASLADTPLSPRRHLIGGLQKPAEGGGSLDVFSPRNGEFLTTIANGTATSRRRPARKCWCAWQT
jgi:hypothetical protein